MVTFPPCLVTFPRCLIAIPCAYHRCTLISLKRLITGDIAMQQVEKHYMAIEVIAVQFFSILVLQSVRRFTLSVLYYNSWNLASLYFSYCCTFQQLLKLSFAIFICTARPITFSGCWDLWFFCENNSHTNFQQTSTSMNSPSHTDEFL